MRNVRIGVVEDDPASCQLVLDYLNRYQQENDEQFTVSVFDDGARIVEKYTPVYDILLLDIEMSEMDGMAAARRIRERDDKVVIVFITAAPQYAISGYEVRALSYLLKPLPWFAFSQELKKSIDMVRRNGDDSMLIETSNGQMRLNLADILYLESIRHTIVIHTLEGKLSINGTLKDMEAKLADHHFFRSNSCYLVNLKHVTGVADQDCVMSNGEQLRVSRPRKKAFLAALTDYMGGVAGDQRDIAECAGRIGRRTGRRLPFHTFRFGDRAFGAADDANHQRSARHPPFLYGDLRMGRVHGVYRGVVSSRAAPTVDHRQCGRIGIAGRGAVFRRQYADLVLDHRYAARIRLHVCDDSARRGHRQTRGPVYYGARVRVGRIGGVAALADRYVHWRARRIRRLRLARDRAACRYVCAVLRSSLDG